MKKLTILSAFLMIWTMGFSQVYDIMLGEEENAAEVVKNDYKKLRMNYSYKGITSFNVKTEKGKFSEIAIPGHYYNGDLGSPKLPATKELIEIPFGAELQVEVTSFDKQTYNLREYGIDYKLMPNQPDVLKSQDPAAVEFHYNEEAYNKNSFTDIEMATVEPLGVMRGVRIARLEINPVRYNPSTNEIVVYNNIEVKVNFNNANITKTQERKENTFSPYFEHVYNKLVNHRTDPDDYPDHPDLTSYPIKYLVVSDPMFEETLQPFLEWKTMQGFQLEVAYTDEIGDTYGEIQSWVHDQYNNSEVTPSFVLFVGDIDQIPMEMGDNSGKYTDLYYGSVDGDMFPEMYYGRFSAQNIEQLQPQIDKTLYYEKYEFDDPSYLDRVTLIAGADGNWNPNVGQPTVQYGTENYFNEANGYSTVNDYLTNYTGCYETVDEGVGFINYTAHCGQTEWSSPNLTISDVNNFENEGMYPLAVGNCCLSNDIGYSSECIGEAWVRKENGGAVAYIGSAPSTYWFEDFYWAVGAFPLEGNNNGYVPSTEETTLGVYDAMFMSDYETVDSKIFVGNLAVTEVDIQGYPQHSNPLYYWEAYMCNGDPSLMLYNTQGEENEVEHMDVIYIGEDTYEVSAEPGSYVGISKDGVLHGSALVGEEGIVEVPIEPILSGGQVDIVVTKRQKIPYITEVPATAADGPYIVLDSTYLDDSYANDNGQADFGETFTLDVNLKNVGVDDAFGVEAVVTEAGDEGYITVNDPNTEDFGNIPADETVLVEEAYSFSVADSIPDQQEVEFNMEITDDQDSVWNSSFKIMTNAPVLAAGNIAIDDSEGGDGNGMLDPGESADIIITTQNNGHADSPEAIGSLSTESDIATVTSAAFSIGTISALGSAEAVFSIQVDEDAEIGSYIDLAFEADADPYAISKTYTLPVGLIIEDFESGDLSNFAWETSGSADWFVTDQTIYEGEYAAASGDIDDDQESVLSIQGNVLSDDSIRFYKKVSSESGYDYLEFHIDGDLIDEWSGEQDWEEVVYDVSEGEHTFAWKYTKDGSVSDGSDMGWIDEIIFPTMEIPSGPLSVNIVASSTEMCEGDSLLLTADVSGGTGSYFYSWSPAFTLSDPNEPETWAYPTSSTTYTLTVSDGDTELTDEVSVEVFDTPEAPEIHQEDEMLVSSAGENNQWCDTEGHIEGATGETFIPEHTGHYHAVVINEQGCESPASNEIYYGYTGEEVVSEGRAAIYPNPFSDKTNVVYTLNQENSLTIQVFNALGEMVSQLENSSQLKAGTHEYQLNADKLDEGIYYVVFKTNDNKISRKLVVVK